MDGLEVPGLETSMLTRIRREDKEGLSEVGKPAYLCLFVGVLILSDLPLAQHVRSSALDRSAVPDRPRIDAWVERMLDRRWPKADLPKASYPAVLTCLSTLIFPTE